jgi:NifU-like protein involved in Fe-S cluster formation
MHPHNVGKLDNADAEATEGSPACGDQVTMFLKVNPETQVIEDIKFLSYGCASNIATASIITDLVKGKTLEEAKKNYLATSYGRTWRFTSNQSSLCCSSSRYPAKCYFQL